MTIQHGEKFRCEFVFIPQFPPSIYPPLPHHSLILPLNLDK